MGRWATKHKARMATVLRGRCVVSERGRDGTLGDGAQGEDGDCASRAWCGEREDAGQWRRGRLLCMEGMVW